MSSGSRCARWGADPDDQDQSAGRGQAAGRREIAHPIIEAGNLVVITPHWTDGGFEPFLPPPVDEQPLARRVHQVTLIEPIAVEQAEILEQLPH